MTSKSRASAVGTVPISAPAGADPTHSEFYIAPDYWKPPISFFLLRKAKNPQLSLRIPVLLYPASGRKLDVKGGNSPWPKKIVTRRQTPTVAAPGSATTMSGCAIGRHPQCAIGTHPQLSPRFRRQFRLAFYQFGTQTGDEMSETKPLIGD